MFEKLDAAARLLIGRGVAVVLIVLTLWLPGNLLLNYLVAEQGWDELSPSLLAMGLAYELLSAPLLAGALFALMRESLYGGQAGYAGAMAAAWRRYGLLFANRLIIQVLVGVGLLAFIVPGLWLMARWALADAVVLFEGVTPAEARARSLALTEGKRLELLAAWQLPVLAVVGLSWWVELRFGEALRARWWLAGLVDCGWDLLLAFPVALLFIYYAQARVREAAALAGEAAA
jgi:hypothetical protein